MKRRQPPRARPLHGRGSSAATLQEWVELAKPTIMTLLDQRLAVPHAELEARLSEQGVPHGAARLYLDPHVLTEAVTQLHGAGEIFEYQHHTKGDATVPLWVPADQHGRATYILKAARRKGMLYARYRRLADHRMGPAGETILRRSLREAGPHLLPAAGSDRFGEVKQLLGVTLFGPLDAAGHLVHAGNDGIPKLYTVPIEMKNRRLVIYPIHKEIHQLLAKAAALQVAHPDQLVVPVFVCRRAHSRLFWMARDLGFLVHQTGFQYTTLPKGTKLAQLEQIRTELGLSDLVIVKPNTPLIRQFFQDTIGQRAAISAARWAVMAPGIQHYVDQLRVEGPTTIERLDLVREIRQEAEWRLPDAGFTTDLLDWSLPDLDEDLADEDIDVDEEE